jgi:hypothetical protein
MTKRKRCKSFTRIYIQTIIIVFSYIMNIPIIYPSAGMVDSVRRLISRLGNQQILMKVVKGGWVM